MKTLSELSRRLLIEIEGKKIEVTADAALWEQIAKIPDKYLRLQNDLEQGKISESDVILATENVLDGILGAGKTKMVMAGKENTLNAYAAMTIHVVRQIIAQLRGA